MFMINAEHYNKIVLEENKKDIKSDVEDIELNKKVIDLETRISIGQKSQELKPYNIFRKRLDTEPTFFTLRDLLADVLEGQGITTQIALGDSIVEFKEVTAEQAKDLISKEGFLGIEQTSDRIVQFALSLIGDDSSKVEEIKESINSGFELASKALGGELPEISKKTYEVIIEKLDLWAQGFEKST